MSTSIPTALIGLGRISWMLEQDPLRYHPCTHAGSLTSSNHKKRFNIYAAADPIQERREKFAKFTKNNKLILFDDHKRLLEYTQPKLAVIAVTVKNHEEVALDTIRSGVHALFLEKPLASSYNSAKNILAVAKKHKTLVWINFERRYHPQYLYVKKIIDMERYGKIRAVRGRVYAGRPSPSSGVLLHDAVHWIDLLLWYAGNPKKVYAKLKASPYHRIESSSWVEMIYSDFHAHLETGTRRYFEFYMEIDFDYGRIILGNQGFRLYECKTSKRYRGFRELREKNFPVPSINSGNSDSEKNPWIQIYREIYRELKSNNTIQTQSEWKLRNSKIGSSILSALDGMKIYEDIISDG